MNPRRFLLVVVSVCALMVFCASTDQTRNSRRSHRPRRCARMLPYHSGGDYKPEATATNKAQVTPVADHNAYPQVPLAKIEILPSAITISGSHYNQRLVVEGTFTDGHQEDLTSQATLTSSNPKVAHINNDFAMAEGDGQATVTATVKGRRASVPFKIEDFTAPAVWSFRNDVQPVLTKMGCNSGPCHGAAAGKNGFKLTLRGYDPRHRLHDLDPSGPGPAHRTHGARQKFDPAEAHAHHPPRRRKALRG